MTAPEGTTQEKVKPPIEEILGGRPLINLRREAFCQNIAKGMDKPEAYIAAGFNVKDRNVARQAAAQILRDITVFNRIQYLLGRKANVTAEEAGITRAWILQMTKDVAERALGGPIIDEESGEVVGHTTAELPAANTALKMLGQEAGAMFRDRSELSGPNGEPIEIRARVQVHIYLPDNGRDVKDGSGGSAGA